MTDPDPYGGWSLSDRLQMLAFEAELARLPRSVIAAIWTALDRLNALDSHGMASSLFDIFQLVGYTIWQLQILESTLGVYFVIVHEVPVDAAREDVQSLFERAEHRTLGKQLTLLRKRSPEGSALVERLERLVPLRNWLVHHSRHNSRVLLTSPEGLLLLGSQIEYIAEEALALGQAFAILLEDHVVRLGVGKEELERRAEQIRDAWTMGAP